MRTVFAEMSFLTALTRHLGEKTKFQTKYIKDVQCYFEKFLVLEGCITLGMHLPQTLLTFKMFMMKFKNNCISYISYKTLILDPYMLYYLRGDGNI